MTYLIRNWESGVTKVVKSRQGVIWKGLPSGKKYCKITYILIKFNYVSVHRCKYYSNREGSLWEIHFFIGM